MQYFRLSKEKGFIIFIFKGGLCCPGTPPKIGKIIDSLCQT